MLKSMENEKKNMLSVIVVIIIVVAVGVWLFWGSSGGGSVGTSSSNKETPTATLAPALQLTPQEKTGDVSAKRAEILALVRSGTPLTQEQKAEIGGIMLTKANLYSFNEAERQDIFKALSK